jgi:ABC-2 type transport system permease protein
MRKITWSLCKREWRRILFDPRLSSLILLVPFIYAFLFGGVYGAGSVKHIPIVIVDQDHSRLSREITTALGASESLSIYGTVNAPENFLPLVRQEAAYACVVIPEHFERDVLGGRKAKVAVIQDGSNLLAGNVSSRAINSVLMTYRVGISAEELSYGGMTAKAAASAALPIEPVLRAPFNPAFNFSLFILMGLICIVAQQVIRMGSSISLLLDEVDELWSGLDEPAPSVGTVFIAKVVATAALVLPMACVAIVIPFALFGNPLRGSGALLFTVLTIYMFTQIFIGYGYSSFFRSPVGVTQLHLFMSPILFVLSGFTWPAYAMPHWLRPIAYCTPAFHMNSVLRKVALDGAGPGLLRTHLLALLAYLLISVPWAYYAVWKQLARTERAGFPLRRARAVWMRS